MYAVTAATPVWLDLLPGVRAQFAPVSRAASRAASRMMKAALDDNPDDPDAASDAMTAELIRRGLRGWEGIADETGVQPLEFTPANVEAFIADLDLFLAADEKYVVPFVSRRLSDAGSTGSPAGTSAAPTPAKRTARAAARFARNAPTKSTPRAPRKAKPPGK